MEPVYYVMNQKINAYSVGDGMGHWVPLDEAFRFDHPLVLANKELQDSLSWAISHAQSLVRSHVASAEDICILRVYGDEHTKIQLQEVNDPTPTLLQRRRKQLAAVLQELIHDVESIKTCMENNYIDLHTFISYAADKAARAARISSSIEDMQDVEKYGPTGGR